MWLAGNRSASAQRNVQSAWKLTRRSSLPGDQPHAREPGDGGTLTKPLASRDTLFRARIHTRSPTAYLRTSGEARIASSLCFVFWRLCVANHVPRLFVIGHLILPLEPTIRRISLPNTPSPPWLSYQAANRGPCEITPDCTPQITTLYNASLIATSPLPRLSFIVFCGQSSYRRYTSNGYL